MGGMKADVDFECNSKLVAKREKYESLSFRRVVNNSHFIPQSLQKVNKSAVG